MYLCFNQGMVLQFSIFEEQGQRSKSCLAFAHSVTDGVLQIVH